MREDLRICTSCGIVFDLKFRSNKDCPLCHRGEYIRIEWTSVNVRWNDKLPFFMEFHLEGLDIGF